MEDRTKYIGGSDVGAILGVNPWRTPLDVFYEKTGLKEVENVDNEAMWWGREQEPLIIKRFTEKTGIQVCTGLPIVYHDKYDFLAAHIDGWIASMPDGRRAIVEAKATGNFKPWGEEGSDVIPLSYKMQVAYYLYMLDVPLGYIPVLFAGNNFKIYEYNRDLDLEKEIVPKLVDFWENHVLKLEPPMPISVEEAQVLYAEMKESSTIVADNKILDNYFEILELQKNITQLKAESDAKKLALMNFMKLSEKLIDNAGEALVTWKNRTSKRFQTTEFKAINPDLYNDFLKESTTRTFLLKGVKDND